MCLILLVLVLLLIAVEDGAATTNTAGTAGSDQTNLLARGAVAGNSGGVTNVLMVTTTVGVLNGVTGNTTNLGPAVTLTAEAVVGVTGLEDGLVNTATATDDTNDGTAGGADGLLVARGELDAGAAGVLVVGDDDAGVARGAGKGAAVSGLGLNAADGAGLGDVADGEDVAHNEGSALTADHGLAGEHALGGDEELLHALVLVGVAELDAGEGGAAANLVLDGLDDTAHVTVALGVVSNAEAGGAETLVAVDGVHGAGALTAGENDLTHDKTRL